MKELYENALREAIEITEKNLDAFIDTFPHVSTNNRYHGEENALWTSSFYPGMCCLAYEIDPNNEDQLKVYDYAYTKAEFRTETPETEISLTLGDIKNLTDNGDGTAEVTVHVKASLATSYRIGAHTQTEIDEEIANGYGPEDWGDFWISWRPSSDVEGICSPEGADVTALIPFVAGQGYCLIFRVRSEDGNTKTEYKPLNK